MRTEYGELIVWGEGLEEQEEHAEVMQGRQQQDTAAPGLGSQGEVGLGEPGIQKRARGGWCSAAGGSAPAHEGTLRSS